MNPVRRFAAALRERRWSHVVIELALLITGILIALAVDGWIDGRRDARLERQYLELLSRDLGRDIKVLEETLEFEEAQVAASVLAYRALRSGVPPEEREAVAAGPGTTHRPAHAATRTRHLHRPAEHRQSPSRSAMPTSATASCDCTRPMSGCS